MMLTRCQDVVEVLTDHLEGALDAEAERALAVHLDECDGCTTYLEQLLSTIGALGLLRDDDPGAGPAPRA